MRGAVLPAREWIKLNMAVALVADAHSSDLLNTL
jgi:hypothetical protein